VALLPQEVDNCIPTPICFVGAGVTNRNNKAAR